MPFEWATRGADFTGALSIKSMGVAGGAGGTEIVTNNAVVRLVDVVGRQGAITESVRGGRTEVNKNDPAASNAFVLPWAANHAVMTGLSGAQDIFVTPDLNGCAVFVAGNPASPTVVHVNSQAEILDKGEPAFSPTASLSQLTTQMNVFKLSYKRPMWDALYLALASKLIELGRLPRDNLQLLLPGQYLNADVGSAAVFGHRQGGNWAFFWNVNGRTTRFWG